jgi:hypothetical protein
VEYTVQAVSMLSLGVGLTATVGLGDRFSDGSAPFMFLASLNIGMTPGNAVSRALADLEED